MFKGQAVSLNAITPGYLELVFDLQGESVNKLNQLTLNELSTVISQLEDNTAVKGLLISSAKQVFIVGADITEFKDDFLLSDADLQERIQATHELFNRIENLPFPTVASINGLALGGGLELALAADYRVIGEQAKIGLPEVSLGLCPGWGGTVRLSRLIGPELAVQWMTTGKPQAANKALDAGAVDYLVNESNLKDKAVSLLEAQASSQEFRSCRARKQQPMLDSNSVRNELADLKSKFSERLDPNYPAAEQILALITDHSLLPFEEALKQEVETFVSLAKTDVAQSLVGLFLNDQLLKRKARDWNKQSSPVIKGAVLGAGIMGGGVAYQSASTGTPIIMKDINDPALQLGMDTASSLLDKKISKGRLTQEQKDQVMAKIDTTLTYEEFGDVDLVVEAVVENPSIKSQVLAEVEKAVSGNSVLTSNTSTISIDQLAESLERPDQFCGMHFFNPVHLMPLVEVIRGKASSDEAIARTVSYAMAMGKVPIVVKDCPGFLVNRILFPYFNAFNKLLQDGVDFQRIDRVMEEFGWPMGPAYLADVVGLDTMVHADHVMQKGFPDRMTQQGEVVIETLLAKGHQGQKNGKGFYEYGVAPDGRRYKEPSAVAREIISKSKGGPLNITDQQIVDRLMVAMCLESVRCLEDGIVDTPAEVDMGLILGLGFPRFRGGALRYIDSIGVKRFTETAQMYQKHGPLYEVTAGLQARANANQRFY